MQDGLLDIDEEYRRLAVKRICIVLIAWLIDWCFNWLIDWLIERFIYCPGESIRIVLIDWLIDLLIG